MSHEIKDSQFGDNHPYQEIILAYCVVLVIAITYFIYKTFVASRSPEVPKKKYTRKKKEVAEDLPIDEPEEEIVTPKAKKSTRAKKSTTETPSRRGRRKTTQPETTESDSEPEVDNISPMRLRSRQLTSPRSSIKR